MNSGNHAKLNVWSLGLALGIVWGLGMFITGLITMWCDGAWGADFVAGMGSIYIGFKATWGGSFLGLIWGFVDAFIAGVIIAWLYNCFARCCKHNKG